MRFLQRLTGKKPAKSAGGAGPRSTARYLRDTPTGIIRSRHAPLSDSRDDIRRSWRQAASLALDIVQNSGRLKGMVDQVLADTVGVELVLNPQPDLAHLGYDQKETTDFIRLVKKRWKKYAWNAAECDFRGKFTLPQQVDIALRWHIVYGEVTGILDYMPASVRRRYGIRTGTKLCLVPPPRLVQDTNEFAGLFQGVYHDDNGRVSAFLLEEKRNGFWTKVRYPARDGEGRTAFLHVFDPVDATDVRGISVMAAGIRKHLQHETLEDVTLQTAILQTFFAAVLTSDQPSADAFEALEAIKDIRGEDSSSSGSEYVSEFVGYLNGSLERAAESRLTVGSDPQVSHLAPGEDFDFKTANTPGPQYQPLSASLSRDMARSVGITYGALTMDHTNATYSSTRMENSSIWPVVTRRRERIAAPVAQNRLRAVARRGDRDRAAPAQGRASCIRSQPGTISPGHNGRGRRSRRRMTSKVRRPPASVWQTGRLRSRSKQLNSVWIRTSCSKSATARTSAISRPVCAAPTSGRRLPATSIPPTGRLPGRLRHDGNQDPQ